MKLIAFIATVYVVTAITQSTEIDSKYLRCLVCRATMNELETKLGKIDPTREVEIGNYRMDAEGNTIHKKVPMRRSEVYISDALDNICEKMSDYVRATYKTNGELTILNLMTPSGQMNPEMSKVDIIQDNDLNKSLQYYCEGIVEEFEDSIIPLFAQEEPNIRRKLCTDTAHICEPEDFAGEDDFTFADDNVHRLDDEL